MTDAGDNGSTTVTTDSPTDAAQPAAPQAKKHGLPYRLYHGETAIDFMGHRNRFFILSAVVILLGLSSIFIRGLNFGIDFKGGTAWEVKSASLTPDEARNVLSSFGVTDPTVEVLSGTGGRVVRVQADIKGTDAATVAKKQDIRNKLADLAKVQHEEVGFTDIGPSWGDEISRKALRALVLFFIAIAIYISIRFEWKMAVAALIAVVHDILVTAGIYSLSGFQVTPGTVIAFLTILGYSLYDTIVVFDRVGENARSLGATGRMTYSDVVNLSMNQTLMRSLNTSLVAILPVLSVLVLGSYVMGATALEDFGLALCIGLLTGAYSSIFIASPVLGMLKEREPRYTAIRQRLANRSGPTGVLTPAAAAASMGVAGAAVVAGAGAVADDGTPLRPSGASSTSERPSGQGGKGRPAGRPSGPSRPAPRPRKKGRRR